MKFVLHPLVYSDILESMEFYEREGGAKLAADFYQEFENTIKIVCSRPQSFPVYRRDLRKVGLRRFPFHFLFSIESECIFILVVRHHRRHPNFGLDR